MLYQATRPFGDFDNGLELPYGGFVETDCIKWVQRMGPFLRPCSATTEVKGKVLVVKTTVEDTLIKPLLIPQLQVTEEVEQVTEEVEQVVVETTPLRRKIKPLRTS